VKNILVSLFVLLCFFGCDSKDKELKKLQIENEKMKGVILKKQVEAISAISNQKEQYILSQWDQLKNAYQRRNDVVHRLVEFLDSHKNILTEKGKQSLTAVTDSLHLVELISSNEGIKPITEDIRFVEFQKEQNKLSMNLTNLMTILEENPKLKAMQDFLDLRVMLEATENRIMVERLRFEERQQQNQQNEPSSTDEQVRFEERQRQNQQNELADLIKAQNEKKKDK
jgi:hypothetical protein